MSNKKLFSFIVLILILPLITRCSNVKKIQPTVVVDLKIERYTGMWYEIARTPNKFEDKCVADVTATYRKRKDGGLNVINRCSMENGEYKISKGIAYFKDSKIGSGALEVTFFKPFYGAYNIVYIDPLYNHALVVSDTEEYMWILSRDKNLKQEIVDKLLKLAKEVGINTSQIIYTTQSTTN